MVKLKISNRIPELENQYSKLEKDLSFEIISTQKILFQFECIDVGGFNQGYIRGDNI